MSPIRCDRPSPSGTAILARMIPWFTFRMRKLAEAEQRAREPKFEKLQTRTDVTFLEDAVERLALMNRAMWELLSERVGVDDRELLEKIREVDLRDGREDDRIRPAPRACPECGRTLSRRHLRCLYCGAADPDGDPFGTI